MKAIQTLLSIQNVWNAITFHDLLILRKRSYFLGDTVSSSTTIELSPMGQGYHSSLKIILLTWMLGPLQYIYIYIYIYAPTRVNHSVTLQPVKNPRCEGISFLAPNHQSPHLTSRLPPNLMWSCPLCICMWHISRCTMATQGCFGPHVKLQHIPNNTVDTLSKGALLEWCYIIHYMMGSLESFRI
jgi:hypothetical protein